MLDITRSIAQPRRWLAPRLGRSAGRILAASVAATTLVPWFAPEAMQAASSDAVIASKGSGRLVAVTGRIVAWRAGRLSTQVPGQVEALYARVGDRVEKGQAIARLNTARLEAERDLAASAEREAVADLDVAKAELDLARIAHTRQERLRTSAAYNRARLEDAKLQIAVAEAKVVKATAVVASRKAAVRQKALDIQLATIRSPYSGVVLKLYAQVGAFLTDEDPHLIEIADDTSLEIEVEVPLVKLTSLRPGMQVMFSFDGQDRFAARVRALLPKENPITRTRPVRLVPLNYADNLRVADGQSVTVFVPVVK